jgi:light-regulated signal transduction histidine kinase (bacteriophytochrome)
MMQILQNLISNAIKFHGDDPPNIHISAEVRANEWILSVKDNGIGVDSIYFEKIFVIFQRLHKRGEYEGTGIGLAICKKIAQRHGGDIWVESAGKNKGSTFKVKLPRKNF